MSKVTLKIDNAYEDGHEFSRVVEVAAPTDLDGELLDASLEDWWEEIVWPETGGYVNGADLNAYYTATITAVEDEELLCLVGKENEWG